MNDDQGPPPHHDGAADPDDTGEPIAELAMLAETPSQGFLGRIRNSIERRMFASDAIDFSLMAMFRTFMDYLTAMIDAVASMGHEKGERK